MFPFILLAVILVLEVAFFIGFFFYTSRMSPLKFDLYCEKLVKHFAKRNKLLCLTRLNISNFERNRISVNHIIFGKKYIYLISDFKLNGFVYGGKDDKSWIYYNRHEKKNKYIVNLNELANQNIKEVSALLGVNSDPFKSICLISNNCDFNLKNQDKQTNHVVHFMGLCRKIRKLEKSNIDSLDKEQIYEEYTKIKETNDQYFE